MVNNESVKSLYKALLDNGYTSANIGDENTFSNMMSDKNNRKMLYDYVASQGDNIGDYDSYEKRLSGYTDLPSQNNRAKQYKNAYDEVGNQAQDSLSVMNRADDTQGMVQPQPQAEKEYIDTFGGGFKQGTEQLYQGLRASTAETANLVGGSSRDYMRASEQLDEMLQSGYDLSNYDSDKALKDYKDRDYQRRLAQWQAEMNKRRAEREDMDFFDKLAHKWNDPDRPKSQYEETGAVADEIQLARSYNIIRDALQETNGDIEAAKALIAERSKEKTWGDKQIEGALDAMSQMKETKGFGAWVGGMIPQMIGNVAGIAAQATGFGKLGALLGIGNMAALTTSSAGSSMLDARKYGASEGDVWKAGTLSGAIEAGTEAIPFARYFTKGQNVVAKGVDKLIGKAIDNNPKAAQEVTKLIDRARKEYGTDFLNGRTLKEYAIDLMAEGASEAVAEGTQTILPMLYQNPEDYPTLTEVLEGAWEGAKGGLFMGAFLGAGSRLAKHHTRDKVRKENGNVMFAETKENGIVEIFGEKDGLYKGSDAEGNDIILTENDIVETASVTYNEYMRGVKEVEAEQKDYEQNATDAYNLGMETDNGADIRTANKDAKKAASALGDEGLATSIAEAANNGSGIDGLLDGLDADKQQQAREYYNQQMRLKGIRDRVESEIQQEIEERNAWIDRVSDNNGMYLGLTITERDERGEEVQVRGNVVGYVGGAPVWLRDGAENTAENRRILKPTEYNAEDLNKAVPKEEKKASMAYIVRRVREKVLENYLNYDPDVYDVEYGSQFQVGETTYVPLNQNEFGETIYQAIDAEGNAVGVPTVVTADEMYSMMQEAKDAAEQQAERSAERAKNEPIIQLKSGQYVMATQMSKDNVHVIEVDEQGNPVSNPEIDENVDYKTYDAWKKAHEEKQQAQQANNVSAESAQNEVAPTEESEQNVSEAVQPSEELADESASEAVASPSQPTIPTEGEEVLYHKVPVDVTLADLNDGTLDEVEQDEFIAAKKAEAAKMLDNLNKKKPKVGTNKAKYLAEKQAWEQKVAEAQSRSDYWNNVEKAMRDSRVKVGDAVAEEVMQLDQAMNGAELAAQMLAQGRLPLLQSSYKEETGYGQGETQGMFGLFRSAENGGMTIDHAAELLALADEEEHNGHFFGGDSELARNTLLQVLSEVRTRGGLNNYISNIREQQAKAEQAAEYEAYEQGIQAMYGVSVGEYEAAYNDYLNNNPYDGVDVNEIDAIFADAASEYEQYLNNIDNGQRTITEGTEGSNDVLLEEQPDNEGRVEESKFRGQAEGDVSSSNDTNEVAQGEEQQVSGFTLSGIDSGKGGNFYQDINGNIDLVEVIQEVMDALGIPNVPFRMTESMANHILKQHGEEIKAKSKEDVVAFVVDIMKNFDHVRQGNDAFSYIFSIENDRAIGKRAITIILPSENGEYLGVKSSGFERSDRLQRRPLLWEKGANETSATDTASANVTSETAQQGGEPNSSASNQSNGLTTGKGSEVSENNKETGEKVDLLALAERIANEEKRRKPLRERIKEWEKSGIKVNVIERIEDVPNRAARAEIRNGSTVPGWYEQGNGEVYIFLPHIKDVKDLDVTILHEAISHKGLRELLGEERFNELCDKVWDMMPKSEKDYFENHYAGVKNIKDPIERRRAAADEYMAHLAEKANLTPEEKTIWDNIVKMFREFLDKALNGVLGKSTINLTDIEQLLKMSYANLKGSDNAQENVGEGTRFRFAKTPQEFDAIQKEAVEKRGIVMPNLNDAVLNIVEVPRHDFTGTGNEAIAKAKEWAASNIEGEHTAKSGTTDEFIYTIDKKSIKKYLSDITTKLSDNLGVHLSVLKMLPNVIDESIEGEIHADYKKDGGRSIENGIEDKELLIHRLYGAVSVNDRLYRVKTTMKEKKNDGVKPYSYEVTKIELIDGSSQNGTSSSNASSNSISAANVLQGVEKSYDKGKKLLDESENTRFRTTYHGSGAEFDRFDHSFMGTGEGAQAFGWGTYVTDVEDIAKGYANIYANNSPLAAYSLKWLNENANYEDFITKGEGKRRKDVIEGSYKFLEEMRNDGASEEVIKNYEKDIEDANQQITEEGYNRTKENMINSLNRNLYQVDIPDNDGTNYLSWNEEPTEAEKKRIIDGFKQSDIYKEFVAEFGKPLSDKYIKDIENAERGEQVYMALVSHNSHDNAPKETSEFLSSIGFVGIEYPTNSLSGGNTDGTKNYVIFNEHDLDIVEHTRFRAVTDPLKIAELEAGKKVKVYRAMQLVDGKLYPPMSAKVNGKMRDAIELGRWEEAEERPEMADDKGYFKLDKGNGKSLKARYNPYIHTSTTPLNDQFSSAQDRPELVTVEVEIPESELTSGYKADKAKDAVGKLEWKAGVVQGKLSGTRTVILSRWDKPIRIVPDSEVADEIVKMFGDKQITMPSNVVTPSLRAELEKRGVPFVETDNQGKEVGGTRFRVTPEEDKAYLDAVKSGDMGTAQSMVDEVLENAGYTIRGEHGTTHKFTIFSNVNANIENSFGKGFYFTSDINDAETNYASDNGADLTNRIELLAERMEYEDGYEDMDYDERLEEARNRLSGGENLVISAAIRMDNPCIFSYDADGVYKETIFDVEENYDEETDEYGEPEGLLVDFVESLNNVLASGEYWGADRVNAYELIYDGEYTADQLKKKMDIMLMDISDEDGNMASSEIFRAALEDMGFDGIIDNAPSLRFQNMGLSRDTKHYIAFQPNQVKQSDAVTYDNDGNVIPLSKRADKANDDIRFRVSEPALDYAEEEDVVDVQSGDVVYTLNNVDNQLYKTSGKYMRRLYKNGEIGRVLKGQYAEIDQIKAREEYNHAKPILEEYLSELEDMKSKSSNAAQRIIDGVISDIEYALDYYKNLSLGKDVWRTDAAPRFRVSDAPFYSNAERAVEGIKQEKATPQQWLAMIEKNGGLKAGEDKWLGLSDWLKGQDAKSLTKQEVLDYINANQIQIEEVNYGDVNDDTAFESLKQEYEQWLREEGSDYAWNELIERFGDDAEIAFSDLGGELVIENEDAASTLLGSDNIINSTRLEYTTKGLENKREIALVVPTIESWNENDEVHFGDAGDGRAVAWIRFGETRGEVAEKESVDKFLADMRSKYNAVEGEEADYMNKDEIKHLQSLTSNEIDARENAPRILVIDEIQSKRHQEGREKGYFDAAAHRRRTAELNEELDNVVEERMKLIESLRNKYPNGYMKTIDWVDDNGMMQRKMVVDESKVTNEEHNRYNELSAKIVNLHLALHDHNKSINWDAVQSAPFEKNWHELAMKRMLRYAAENGYDKVAWTKGAQQAERYKLGDIIDELNAGKWQKDENGFSDKPNDEVKEVYASLSDGGELQYIVNREGVIVSDINDAHQGRTLTEVFGKDIAVKLMGEEKVSLKDAQLVIGADGMKGFYDEILPRFMNKYGKKWGVKVGEVELPHVEESARKMWSVDVTDAMKDSVMEGQPMFRISNGGLTNDQVRALEFVTGKSREEVVRDYGKPKNRISKKDAIEARNEMSKFIPRAKNTLFYNSVADLLNPLSGISALDKAYIIYTKLKGIQFRGFYNGHNKNVVLLTEYILNKDRAKGVIVHEYTHLVVNKLLKDGVISESELDDVLAFCKRRYPDIYRKATIGYKESAHAQECISYLNEHFYGMLGDKFFEDATFAGKSKHDKLFSIILNELKNEEGTNGNNPNNGRKGWSNLSHRRGSLYGRDDERGGRERRVQATEQGRASGNSEGVRFRVGIGAASQAPLATDTISAWDKLAKSTMFQLRETAVDYLTAVEKFQDLIAKKTKSLILGFEDCYQALLHLSSRNKDAMDMFDSFIVAPLNKVISKLTNGEKVGDWETGKARELVVYVEAKHGLERNRQMAVEQAAKKDKTTQKSVLESWQKTKETILNNTSLTWRQQQEQLDAEAIKLGADLTQDHSGLSDEKLFGDDSIYRDGWKKAAYDAVEAYENANKGLTDELWQCINNATEYSLRKQLDSGLVDKDYVATQLERFQYYVPLRGFSEEIAEEVYAYMGETRRSGSPVKKARGRVSEADNPFGAILQVAYSSISVGNKNLAKQKLLNLVQNHDTEGLVQVNKGWIVKFDTAVNEPLIQTPQLLPGEPKPEWVEALPVIPSDATPQEISKILADFEAKMAELKDADESQLISGKNKTQYRTLHDQRDEHQILVMRGGKPYVITIVGNPRLAQAVNGLLNPDSGDEGTLLDTARRVQRFMAGAFTSHNPAFSFANISRDTIYSNNQAFIKENPLYWAKFTANQKLGFGMWGRMIEYLYKYKNGKLDLSKKEQKLFKEFMENGGATGYTFVETQKESAKKLAEELKNLGNGSTKLTAKVFGKSLLDCLEFMGQTAEIINRYAAYKTSREMGRSISRSITDAKEITVNFNRKGAGMKTYDKNNRKLVNIASAISQYGRESILFWNANMQAKYRLYKNMKEHPLKTSTTLIANSMFIGGVAIPVLNDVLLPSLYSLFGWGGDDDEEEKYYDVLTDWERTHNICLRLPNSNWLKIPLSPEMIPFYSMGDIINGNISGKREFNVSDYIASAIDVVTPVQMNWEYEGWENVINFTPTFTQPLLQNFANVNYMGNNIAKESMFGNVKTPEFRNVYRNTSSTLVGLSKLSNKLGGGNYVEKGVGITNWNPAYIQNLISGYTGGYGTSILAAADWIVDTANNEPQAVIASKLPLVSRFFISGNKDIKQRRLDSKYYDVTDFCKEVEYDLREYKKGVNGEFESYFTIAESTLKLNELMKSERFSKYNELKPLVKEIKRIEEKLEEVGEDELTRALLNEKKLRALEILDEN